MNTLYWHDYETWGANPAVDRPSQFAGLRTDEDLNIIGEPLVEYCRPPLDVLPFPEASLITGITPQLAAEKGLPEYEFIRRIHEELSTPETCAVGYNSVRFDDEVTRYTLYRNFYDPYEREWRNGNSRWDIVDMLRLVYALRPEGIEWPVIDGKPSFKLERLTEANGLLHSAAHDALSDVEATIALAKLVKTRQPRLFDYVYRHRSKTAVGKMIDIAAKKPLLHISSMFPAERGCAALVVPLAVHPRNNNAVLAFDLCADPSPLETLAAEDIAERIFTRADADTSVQRIPIKAIHLNKCPILAPSKMLDAATARRLGVDRDQCEAHWRKLLNMELEYKLRSVFKEQSFAERTDPEQQLYDGFIGDRDKHTMRLLREASAEELKQSNFVFEDARLNAMVVRYKARNFPETMSAPERDQWHEFCRHRLLNGGENTQSIDAFLQRVQSLAAEHQDTPKNAHIMACLKDYGLGVQRRLQEDNF